MFIKHIDDLHMECFRDHGIKLAHSINNNGARVLTLGGDITTPYNGYEPLLILADKFEDIVYIFGNHDYWHSSGELAENGIREFIEKNKLTNLHFLKNEIVTIEGHRFLGTTMWIPWQINCLRLQNYMNDFKNIENAKTWIYEENKVSTKWLEDNIQEEDIVMTHHLPSYDLIDPEYQEDEMNIFYAERLTALIEMKKPKLWLHGHSHTSCDIQIGNTRCIRNPMGYGGVYNQINYNWNPELLIEV
jgi:Icc-related predicted phosphoesterase